MGLWHWLGGSVPRRDGALRVSASAMLLPYVPLPGLAGSRGKGVAGSIPWQPDLPGSGPLGGSARRGPSLPRLQSTNGTFRTAGCTLPMPIWHSRRAQERRGERPGKRP